VSASTRQINKANTPRPAQVLEQHCSFFDPDGDGVIWPSDTYRVCRSFDWKIFTSLFFTAFLHSVQSYNTQPGFLPDPFFRLYVKRAYMNKHGSGTGTFDSEGRFRPQPLEDFFAKFDRDGKGGLTKWELWHGLQRSRLAFDFFGQVSAMFEWGFAWVLIWPEDGILRKEDVRRLCDGSLYHEMVARKSEKRVGGTSSDISSQEQQKGKSKSQ
jgi:peroxygenase